MKRLFLFIMTLCLFSGCGYHLQGTRNPLQNFGIQKIYVEHFRNGTYRPGLEQLFTTAMVREIEKGKTFKIVGARADADAILSGRVTSADYYVVSTSSVEVTTDKSLQVATEYVAAAGCQVTLAEPSGRVIFSQSFSGNKNYTGAAIAGDSGATVPLTNDSEQRLAFQFLSNQMMVSAYQRMIDLF